MGGLSTLSALLGAVLQLLLSCTSTSSTLRTLCMPQRTSRVSTRGITSTHTRTQQQLRPRSGALPLLPWQLQLLVVVLVVLAGPAAAELPGVVVSGEVVCQRQTLASSGARTETRAGPGPLVMLQNLTHAFLGQVVLALGVLDRWQLEGRCRLMPQRQQQLEPEQAVLLHRRTQR